MLCDHQAWVCGRVSVGLLNEGQGEEGLGCTEHGGVRLKVLLPPLTLFPEGARSGI